MFKFYKSARYKGYFLSIGESKMSKFKKFNRRYYNFIRPFVAFYSLLWIIYNKLTSKFIIPYIELVITTNCNLKCEDCLHLINLYGVDNHKHSQNIVCEELLDDINILAENSDRICVLKLIGGEPFLYKELHILIDEIDKIKNIDTVQITTNGVTTPNKENIRALKSNKVLVVFSGYSINPNKTNKILKIFDENKINYRIEPLDGEWTDMGIFEPKKRNKKENMEIFENCGFSACNSLLNRYIYVLELLMQIT